MPRPRPVEPAPGGVTPRSDAADRARRRQTRARRRAPRWSPSRPPPDPRTTTRGNPPISAHCREGCRRPRRSRPGSTRSTMSVGSSFRQSSASPRGMCASARKRRSTVAAACAKVPAAAEAPAVLVRASSRSTWRPIRSSWPLIFSAASRLAAAFEPAGLAGENGERRLEPVGQRARPVAGLPHELLLPLEQPVEVVDHRLDLARETAARAGAARRHGPPSARGRVRGAG